MNLPSLSGTFWNIQANVAAVNGKSQCKLGACQPFPRSKFRINNLFPSALSLIGKFPPALSVCPRQMLRGYLMRNAAPAEANVTCSPSVRYDWPVLGGETRPRQRQPRQVVTPTWPSSHTLEPRVTGIRRRFTGCCNHVFPSLMYKCTACTSTLQEIKRARPFSSGMRMLSGVFCSLYPPRFLLFAMHGIS